MSDEAVSLMVVEPPIHNATEDNSTLTNTEHSIPVEVVDNLNEEIIEELAKQVQAAAAASEQQIQETAEQTLVDSAMQAVNQDVLNTSVHNNAAVTTDELVEDDRHIEITIGDPVAEKVIDSCVGTVCLSFNAFYYK